MPLSDYQLLDLYQKTNIIYNVVSNTLDAKVSSVTGNVINTTNGIVNRLNQVGAQVRADTNYQTAQIGQYINTQTGQIYKDINTATNLISNNIQLKIGAVSQDIQKKIDSSNAILGEKLNTLNAELKQQITTIVNPILQEITKSTTNITNNLNNSIIAAQTDLKQSSILTQGIVKDTTNNILSKLTAVAQTTIDLIEDTPDSPTSYSGFIPGDSPYNVPTSLAAWLEMNNIPTPEEGDTLFSSIIRIVSGDATADVFKHFTLENVGEGLSAQLKAIQDIIDKTSKGDYTTLDQFYADFKRIGVNTDFIGGVLQFLFIIPSLLNIGKELSGAFNARIQQLTVSQYGLRQMDTNTIVLAFIRNLISYEKAISELKEIGHKREDAEYILKEAFPRFTAEQLFRLGHLGKMDGKQIQTKLRELGWNEYDAILQGYLHQPRPGILDLIQFAVKEVYTPEITSKFGQFQEFPPNFAKEAELLGLDETYAKQYWGAHWDLPSPTMGYDMFHRRIITLDDLKALLKALDVMPYWRDKLIQLNYNVVGRVDTRRLYAYGIWNEQKVYENYLDQGYAPKDARDLTNFTVALDDEKEDKHKSQLKKKAHDVHIKAFTYGLQSHDQALQNIVALGYKEADVKLELSLERYEEYVNAHKPKRENHVLKVITLSIDGYRKRAIARKDFIATLQQNGYNLSEANTEADYIDKEADILFKETIVKEIQKLYFESLLDDNGVLTRLVGLGFANSEALETISQLQILKGLDDKKPTPAQFEQMYRASIIGQEEYAQILAELGYNQKYIPKLITLADSKD